MTWKRTERLSWPEQGMNMQARHSRFVLRDILLVASVIPILACPAARPTCPAEYSTDLRVSYHFNYDLREARYRPELDGAQAVLTDVQMALEQGQEHILTIELVGVPPELVGDYEDGAIGEIRLPVVEGATPTFPEPGTEVRITTRNPDESTEIALYNPGGALLLEAMADGAWTLDAYSGRHLYASRTSTESPCYGGINARDDHDLLNQVDAVLVTPVDIIAELDTTIRAPPLRYAIGSLGGSPMMLAVHRSQYEETPDSASDAQAFFMSAYLVQPAVSQ